MRILLPSLKEPLEDIPMKSTNECRDTSVEGWNEDNTMYHTCLLGKQIALANKGVAPRTEDTEK
eukprot:13116855-Ditylum_brightwellii.AAC.1